MDEYHGNSYDTLCSITATVTCAFTFRNILFCPSNSPPVIGLWYLWTSSIHPVENKEDDHRKCGYGNETLHLTVGDNNLLPTAGIGDILQISDLRLDTLHIGEDGHGQKADYERPEPEHGPFFLFYTYLVLQENGNSPNFLS